MKFATVLLTTIGLLGCCTLGCQKTDSEKGVVVTTPPDEHSHDHEHPENLKDAVRVLEELYTVIKAGFESGDAEVAHGELHEIGHLLEEDFPQLIEKESSLSAETRSQMESQVATLFDAFSKLDGVLHDGPEVEFSEIDAVIAPALEELKNLIP